MDAQWVKKRGETHFGYKDRVVVCWKTKSVRNYAVTPANVHDSKVAAHRKANQHGRKRINRTPLNNINNNS